MYNRFTSEAGVFYKRFSVDFWSSLFAVFYIGVACVLVLGSLAGIFMGVWWVMWSIWTYIMPQIATSMPYGFQYPSYWTFVGCLVLLAGVRSFIKGIFTKPTKED